jgi:lipopolysaccharide export system ATP-binding protein
MSLIAEDIFKSYKERKVVDGITLCVNKGEIVGLLGPNGAGKTTCFYIVVGLVKPDLGKITIEGRNITHLPVYERARLGIGYLPQEPSAFRNLTVRENIELVIQESELVYEKGVTDLVMQDFGIYELQDTFAYALSGGERRRVEIARCIAMQPSFILLDEPFSGIDPIAVADIQEVIKSLRDIGYGILITDHNVRETLSITDRAYLIHEGKIVVHGTPNEITESELARKFYLGANFSWGESPNSKESEKIDYDLDDLEGSVSKQHATTDEEWAKIAVYFEKKQKIGRPAKNSRDLVDAMLWIFKTGAPWRDLPPEYGKWKTVYNNFSRLRDNGVWENILRELNISEMLPPKKQNTDIDEYGESENETDAATDINILD